MWGSGASQPLTAQAALPQDLVAMLAACTQLASSSAGGPGGGPAHLASVARPSVFQPPSGGPSSSAGAGAAGDEALQALEWWSQVRRLSARLGPPCLVTARPPPLNCLRTSNGEDPRGAILQPNPTGSRPRRSCSRLRYGRPCAPLARPQLRPPAPTPLQLYQVALHGLKNALQQTQAAVPALAAHGALLSALAPAASPASTAALQLLQAARTGRPPQPPAVQHAAAPSAAALSAAAAAAGLPGAAAQQRGAAQASPAQQQLPLTLQAVAGLLGNMAGSSDPPGPSSSGGAAGMRRDRSTDPAASDASQEPQRKRSRREDGGEKSKVRGMEAAAGGGPVGAGRPAAAAAALLIWLLTPCPPAAAASPHHPPQVCSNCHTNNTPFWRKDRHTGLPLCNACG